MQYNLIQSDILIKYPDTKPQEIIEIENITININHNKAILEKLELFKLLDFFKQLSVNITPKLLIADSPISNFKRRKWMPIGWKYTLRNSNIVNFLKFYKLFLLPNYIRSLTFNKNIIFIKINNSNSYSIGINKLLNKNISFNINIKLNNKTNNLNYKKTLYFFSFIGLPITVK